MAKAKVKVLAGGRRQILAAASGFASFAPHSFQVGSLAGFNDANELETLPRGDIVFRGDAYLMQARLLEEGVVRYTFVLPEGAGPFPVGNVVMYSVGVNSTSVPFAMVILPFTVTKKVSEYDTGMGLPNPGNRMVVSFTLKHDVVEAGDDENVVVEVISPEYSNLPYFDSEVNLPSPALNPWNQFIIQKSAIEGRPAFVTKDAAGRYWTMPFFKDVRHPKYNVLSGGAVGDNHRESPFGWLWGHTYKTPEGSYRGRIGGHSYKAIGVAPLNRVGGVPYKLPAR